jgi:hypothetical protein
MSDDPASRDAFVYVRKGNILAATDAIRKGIEVANCILAQHDAGTGRKTYRDRAWAETLERDIASMTAALCGLPAWDSDGRYVGPGWPVLRDEECARLSSAKSLLEPAAALAEPATESTPALARLHAGHAAT